MRKHTGDKPYLCSYCERAFILKDSLKIHLRAYTGDNPYQCSLCIKAFADNNSLILASFILHFRFDASFFFVPGSSKNVEDSFRKNKFG